MNSIIKWTIKLRKASIIWWSLGLSVFIFINLIFYPSFKNDAAELEKSFENIPDAALQLFGGSSDFFSPIGYANSQLYFLMLPMLLGILAISLGAGLLTREETDKTIESLLARPVSRTRLLSSKAMVGFVILTFVTATVLATILVTSKLIGLEIASLTLIAATFVCFLFALSLGAFAYLLTATGRAKGASVGIAAFVGIGGYLISSLSGTIDWLSTPSKLFPFDYYQSESILRGTYNWANILYFAGFILICGLLAWITFRRRDIA